MLPDRLSKIDETSRSQHAYLREDDVCFYFGEYFAGGGFGAGPTNDLILNFKIAPEKLRANPARMRYKTGAIHDVATSLRKVVSEEVLRLYTWVPIPPSKAIEHPDHDPRCLRALELAFQDTTADVRPLLRQTTSTKGDHALATRQTPAELSAILEVDLGLLRSKPLRQRVVLFDDVLSSGKHFRCGIERLREAGVAAPIIGVFVARRVVPDPVDDFETLNE